MSHPATRAGPPSPAEAAKSAPARGVRVRDVAGGQGARSRPGHLLGRRWAAPGSHRPPQRASAGGLAPQVAPAGVADIVPQPQRVETAFGGLEILDGIFAGPAQIADGL